MNIVVLFATSAGILTIYGLELTGAEIMVGTSDECWKLVARCRKVTFTIYDLSLECDVMFGRCHRD